MKIINLEKTIGKFHLSIANLTMQQQIYGLIGNNGCGKTTLLKLIAGILSPDLGEIDFGDVTNKDITITSQRPYMLHDSVYNNLVYPLKIRKLIKPKNEIMEWLDKCGLTGKEKQYAPGLSSGERQKLSIARALVFHPKVVLIDETFSNLDPDSVVLFEELIKEIQKVEPIIWIIVSHQLAHIYRICDTIHFMDSGTIISSGKTEDIFSNTDNPVLKQYLSKYIIGN